MQLSEAGSREAEDNRQQVTQRLAGLLEEVNSGLSRHEQLSCLVIVRDAWTVENGFMTPTLKIKRNVVEATYQDQFEHWSVSGTHVVWQADQ